MYTLYKLRKNSDNNERKTSSYRTNSCASWYWLVLKSNIIYITKDINKLIIEVMKVSILGIVCFEGQSLQR